MSNINDVAKFAGVSRSTVSRVIRKDPNVNIKTRQLVLDAIRELNYAPNTSARALAGRKTKTIGIISGFSLNDPFYSIMVERICYRSYQRDYNTLISVNLENESSAQRQIDMMWGKVDAYIFIGSLSICKEDIKRLLENNIVVATFKTGEQLEGVINVDIDNQISGYKAINYLLHKGYDKIAYLYGRLDNGETQLRMKGYMEALKEANITFDESFCFEGKFNYKSAYDITEQIMKKSPTAIFCENDVMAHGVMRRLKELNCKIPEDVAVMGFDGIQFNNYESLVKLTTVQQPLEKMAEYLVDIVIKSLNREQVCNSKIFDTEILERETV